MDRNRRRKQRGAVLVEYAFVLVAFAIPAIAGLLAGGRVMYNDYVSTKGNVMGPLP